MMLLAVFLAAGSACALAVATHLQHRGVAQIKANASDRLAAQNGTETRTDRVTQPGRLSVLAFLHTPVWLLGSAVMVVTTMLNVIALALAPVALVQPMGVLSLVCAALISSRALGLRISLGLSLGIAACTVGVMVFVWTSATTARTVEFQPATARALAWMLGVAAVAGIVVAATGAAKRRQHTSRRAHHLVRVAAAGVLFGLMALSIHAVGPELVARVMEPHGSAPISDAMFVLLIALVAAVGCIGTWLVQTAYASGPPETVLAGLTVLDPMVAVLLGTLVLGEYGSLNAAAAVWLAASTAVAVTGIVLVVRHHPGVGQRVSQPVPPPPDALEHHDNQLLTKG